MVFLIEGAFDLLAQNALVEDVLDSNPDTVDLVRIGGTNSSSRRTDLALPQEALGYFVERAVVLGNDVGM